MKKQTEFREFIQAVAACKSSNDLSNFFRAILTPKELEEIPNRLQIVKMLKQGIPQREIAEKLGVGIATVTRGSKEINKNSFKDIK